MKMLGRQLSKWWLLIILPLLFMCSPIVLMLFFMGNNLAGAIVGPPAIWSRTFHNPPREDLVGSYIESEDRFDRQIAIPAAALTLNADGSMHVENLPMEWPDDCTLSGNGSWNGPDSDQKIDLTLVSTSTGEHGLCKAGSYEFLELAGHSRPYKLYWVVGDPDSGTGVWLVKK